MSVEVGKIYMENIYDNLTDKFYQKFYNILSKDNLYINFICYSTLHKDSYMLKVSKNSGLFKRVTKIDSPTIHQIFQEIKIELL